MKRWILEVSFSLPTGDDVDEYDFLLTKAFEDALGRYGCKHVDGKFETLTWPDCGEEACENDHGEVQGRSERFEFHGADDLEDDANDDLYEAVLVCQLFADVMYVNIQDAETAKRVHEWSAFGDDEDEPDRAEPSIDAVLDRARNLQ